MAEQTAWSNIRMKTNLSLFYESKLADARAQEAAVSSSLKEAEKEEQLIIKDQRVYQTKLNQLSAQQRGNAGGPAPDTPQVTDCKAKLAEIKERYELKIATIDQIEMDLRNKNRIVVTVTKKRDKVRTTLERYLKLFFTWKWVVVEAADLTALRIMREIEIRELASGRTTRTNAYDPEADPETRIRFNLSSTVKGGLRQSIIEMAEDLDIESLRSDQLYELKGGRFVKVSAHESRNLGFGRPILQRQIQEISGSSTPT